jgi:hypothetical protein
VPPQSTAAAADLVHGSVNVIAAANYVSFFAAQAHGAMNIRVLAAKGEGMIAVARHHLFKCG